MSEEFNQLNEEERLKAENDFLKMKLMLQHGARFEDTENKDLPADIENQFLNNMMAFEEEFAKQKTIKVFDKIGRPTHFKPVAELQDDEMEQAYQALMDHLNRHAINLGACSPNVTTRELYRFVMEELFEHETDDINLPGWTTNFIYDEFHPDHVYDNTRIAVEDCIPAILGNGTVEYMPHLLSKELHLNERTGLTEETFKAVLLRFKAAYESLELQPLQNVNCMIRENFCTVSGEYKLLAGISHEVMEMAGNWKVFMVFKEEWGYWYVSGVEIENISF